MTLYAGAISPETLVVAVDTDDGVDLSGITGQEFTVENPDGQLLTWTWSLTSAAVDEVVFTHTFASNGSDAVTAGDYIVSGWLLTGVTRTRRIEPLHLPFERYT